LRDPQPELSDERRTAITRIIEEISHPASRLEAVADLRSAAELQYLLSIYNWDDGYAIPTAIAMHPKCDLAVALELFWLAWAVGWYLKEVAFTEFDDEAEFCCLITNGILNGQYRRGTTSYNLGLTASQLYRYRKQGVPEILLSNVHGTG